MASPTNKGSKLPKHREREQEENQKRVQRQRLEKMFMGQIQKGGQGGRLMEYESLKGKHVDEQQPVQFRLKNPVGQDTMRLIEAKREREKRSAPKPQVYNPIRAISDFEGPVRVLEATQGGATLWCGDQDGKITIRNGKTGEQVHFIEGTGGLVVDALYSTDTHMWVGLNDGTVRIYDHLVYILVSEAKFHDDSVTCFTATFDGKVFSAGLDSQIIKWDTEPNNFEVMAKWTSESGQKIRCLACYGYQLFVGGDNATVLSFDTENGTVLKRFDGHQSQISALLVQDGFLFSGSLDQTVRAWDMDTGECIFPLGSIQEPPVGHASPVTALVGDAVAHRFWSSDSSGIIHVWESTPENDFKHLYELKDHEGPPITCLRNFCTVDAVKMWSITSGGKNRCWYSAVNKSEDCIAQTIEAMESIITQDLVELAKWKELVDKLEGIDAERKRKLGECLMATTDDGLRRYRWLQWCNKYIIYKNRRKRQQQLAEHLMNSTDRGLTYTTFSKLEQNLVSGKKQRQKQALVKMLERNTGAGLKLLYWKKAKAYVELQKKRARFQMMVGTMMTCTDRGNVREKFRRWRKWRENKAQREKRKMAATTLMLCTDRGLMRVYYTKLTGYQLVKQKRRMKTNIAESLLMTTDRGSRRVYYMRWLAFRSRQRRRRQRQAYSDCLENTNENALRRRYYNAWGRAHEKRSIEKINRQIVDENERKKVLKEQYDSKNVLLDKLARLEARTRELDELKKQRQAMEDDRLEKLRELEELRRKVKERQDGRAAREEKAKREQVEDFLALLKAKVLNYHRDFALIEMTRKQVEPRGKVPVQKVFLESHMSIKRVVIEVTKTEVAPGARWEALRKKGGGVRDIGDHHKTTVLSAIKVMIICYDLMPVDVRESLETDDEILNNTDYLELLAKIGKQLEDSRRGHRTFTHQADGSPSRSRKSRGSSARPAAGGGEAKDASRGGSRKSRQSRKSTGSAGGAVATGDA